MPVSVESRRFQTFNNQEAYCSNKNIYKIDAIVTGSATYKIVNYNKQLSSVECCSGDFESSRQCVNNRWVELPKPDEPITASNSVQCSAIKQCPGFEFSPYDSNTLVKYVCRNSLCVPETKDVECTTNIQCSGSTPVCDTLTYECVSAPAPQISQAIILTKSQCEQKAKDNPLLGYSYIETTIKPSLIQEIITFGFAKNKIIGECKATYVNYYIIAGIVIVLGTVTIILSMPKKKRRRR